MKRLHVHVAVNDIPQSIGFYSALFAAQSAVENAARVAHEKQSACGLAQAAPAKAASACC
jgi:hypothetical protein